jgi:serine O-acetyltransferase
MSTAEQTITRESLMRDIRARHPRFREAMVADAAVWALYRGERSQFHGRLDTLLQILRLLWSSDAFLAQSLYRAKARLQALGVPILPRLCHRLAIVIGQVTIGDPVVIGPGLYINHGLVVIDGITEIGPRARIAPFTSIGLVAGSIVGPTIGADVQVGTGARVLGKLEIGDGAQIGANAVVLSDVEAGTTVVGVPAKRVG